MLFKDIEIDLKNFNKIEQDEYSNKLYNEAIDLIKDGDLSNAYILVRKSVYIDEYNTTARNLYGILSLIMCEFDKSFENFYISLKIKKDDIAEKYVEYFLSDKFTCFIKEYNTFIKYVNLGEYDKAIEGFKDITRKNNYLIEPNLILYYIYKDIHKLEEAQKHLNRIRQLDKGHEIFYNNESLINKEIYKDINHVEYRYNSGVEAGKFTELKNKINECENTEIKYNRNRVFKFTNIFKNKRGVLLIICLLISVLAYNSYEIILLKSELGKDSNLAQVSKSKEDKSVANSKKNIKEKFDTSVQSSDMNLSVQETFEKAIEFKNNKEYYNAINLYKEVEKDSQDKNYISESIYQVASLCDKLEKYSDAEKYYTKYIEKYNKEYPYYEESYYNLGLLYYNNGQLEKSKDTFREFKKKVPNSEYNNSKVQEILKK
nr:tetratricopeptide repeat protein [Clostridioides sp.]